MFHSTMMRQKLKGTVVNQTRSSINGRSRELDSSLFSQAYNTLISYFNDFPNNIENLVFDEIKTRQDNTDPIT